MVNNDFDQGGVFVLVWYNQIILFVVPVYYRTVQLKKKTSPHKVNTCIVIPVENVKKKEDRLISVTYFFANQQ